MARIVDLATGEVLLSRTSRPATSGACASRQGRADPRLGQARRHPRPQLRHAGRVLARPGPPARERAEQEGRDVPEGPRHRGPGHPDHVAGARHAVHARARDAAGRTPSPSTGNILRDYLTDLFPILELGTSAKMLSIVPLMAGGGLYETGAGGSAPKHVSSWSRRTTCAGIRSASSSRWRCQPGRPRHQDRQRRGQVLAKTLDAATGKLLDNNKCPSRKTGELDNRGSQFYLALYWAQALAAQTEDKELAAHFAPLAKTSADNEDTIVAELAAAQGKPADIGGYYQPDPEKTTAVMRPSKTLNDALAAKG